MSAGETAFEFAHGVASEARAQARLDIGGDDPPAIGNMLCAGQPFSQRAHAGGRLQRVAGRDHEPELVQSQMPDGLPRDMQMPPVRWIERAAEQSDFQTKPVAETRWFQGRTWPVPRTT